MTLSPSKGFHTWSVVKTRAAMKHLTTLLSLALIIVLLAGSASAHPVDVVKPGRRLGPIKFGSTTLAQTKEWFGSPTQRKRVKLCGSYPYTRVKWGRKLRVFFYKGDDGQIASLGSIHRRRIKSRQHGKLGFHTKRACG